MREIEYVRQPFAAGRFVMHQRGVRRIYDEPAGLVGTQAEIQVIVDDRVRLVERAERLEQIRDASACRRQSPR